MADRVILVPESRHTRLLEFATVAEAKMAMDDKAKDMVFIYNEADEDEMSVGSEEALFILLAHRLMGRVLEHEKPNAIPPQ